MDFPIFEFPYLGTRYLIAIIAILHVVVNHGAAIGGSLVTVMLERKGWRDQDPRYEQLAYRLAAAFFIVTTSVGAMSGVGIWFSTMVGQPTAIGSMLRIFFWAWFVEWLVFVTEVGLVMAYFLSWKAMSKEAHLRLGWAYVACSTATMAIITGILGFMLTPGTWHGSHTLASAFFNATYLPQVLLRAGIATALAAAFAMVLARWLAPQDFQVEVTRYMSRFLLGAVPAIALGFLWYLAVLPDEARALLPTALVSLALVPYVHASYVANAVICLLLAGLGVWGLRGGLPIMGRVVALVAVIGLLGQFERVREFARKPFMIPGYLYANGLRAEDRTAFDRDGILPHARFASVHQVTPDNRLEAGHEVFKLECAACHTLGGANDLQARLAGQPASAIEPFIGSLHEIHPFMPPFMGTAAERQALAEFLAGSANTAARP